MILQGQIDASNQLWVTIKVSGDTSSQEIPALIDTGFTGDLWLPLRIAVPLGLKLSAISDCQLADGSISSNQMVFSATISWGTQTKSITVIVADVDDALIGGGLLHGYVLEADFQKKKLTIKEPGTDDPQPTT